MYLILLLYFSFNDPSLDSVATHLPAKWNISISNHELTISYPDSVYACYHNMINAYENPNKKDTLMDKNGIPLSVKNSCREEMMYAKFRMDARWSDEKWKAAEKKNDSLNDLLKNLPDKIGIDRRFLFGMYPSSEAPHDLEEKKKEYYKEESALRSQLITLPEFETAHYSLVRIAYNGSANESGVRTEIWPKKENDEIEFIMEKLLPAYCPKRK